MRASLTSGDSLENGHIEGSDKDGKGGKVKKVKAKVDREKKAKRDKNGTHSQSCLLSPSSSFSDHEHQPLAILNNESRECVDTPKSLPSFRDQDNPELAIDIDESVGSRDPAKSSFGHNQRKLNNGHLSEIETDANHSDNASGKYPPKSPEKDKDAEEKRRMYDMLQAITDSYKGIQHRLDIVGDGMKTSAAFVHSNWRNVERLLIALLLIPAFVMSTLAIYRQSDKGYVFDLGEIQKEQLYYVALKNFDSWNEALMSQDSTRISNLYATDLSFLPTMSDQFVVSARSEDKYFMHFVEQQPAGIIIEDKVQPLGTDAYLHTGLYNFIIMSNYTASGFSQVHARFTFLWRSFDGAWKILHHHSSQMPSAFKCAAPAPAHAEGGHTRSATAASAAGAAAAAALAADLPA